MTHPAEGIDAHRFPARSSPWTVRYAMMRVKCGSAADEITARDAAARVTQLYEIAKRFRARLRRCSGGLVNEQAAGVG